MLPSFTDRRILVKPFFQIEDNQLVQRNVPVPRPSQKDVTGPYRHFFGYSYFIHKLMMSRFKGYWLQGKNWLQTKKAHSYGTNVACLLFHRLDALAKSHGVKETYILIQYTSHLNPGQIKMIDTVLPCIKGTSLKIIDLRIPLAKIKKANKEKFYRFFKGPDRHMSYKGNYFVASKLQEAM